jgi:hypothetical protein
MSSHLVCSAFAFMENTLLPLEEKIARTCLKDVILSPTHVILSEAKNPSLAQDKLREGSPTPQVRDSSVAQERSLRVTWCF